MTAFAYGDAGAEMALTPTAVKTSAYTASPGNLVPCDISAAGFPVQLPSAPADGTRVGVKVIATSPVGQYLLTVSCQGSDVLNKAGGSASFSLVLLNQGALFLYAGGIWYITTDDLPLTGVKELIPDWYNVRLYGAALNGTTDDTAACQAALNAAAAQGGGTVYRPWGPCLVSAPLRVGPYTTFVGQEEVTLNFFTTPPTSPPLSRIIIASGFTPDAHGAGAVGFYSKTPGGWAEAAAGSSLRNTIIDGSGCTNTAVQGVAFVGPVYDTHIADVLVWKSPHNGVSFSTATESGIGPTSAYHQRWDRVCAVSSTNVGLPLANMTDSDCDVFAFQNGSDGVQLNNNSNSRFRVRSEWNTGRGLSVTGSSGSVVVDLSTDQNAKEGLYVSGASGQATSGGGLRVTGKLHSDGTAGGSDNYGVKVTGSTVPMDLIGLNVEVGQNSSTYFPAVAIEIDTSSNVSIIGGTYQGVSTAYSDGGGNSSVKRCGVIGMTGNPGSQQVVALPDLPYEASPQPAEQGLLAWSYDPAMAGSGTAIGSGTLSLSRIAIREPQLITNGIIDITSAASAVTANENFIGLYNPAGTLVAHTTTGQIDSALTSAATLTAAFSSAYQAAPGLYWLAVLVVAGTPPSLLRCGLSGTPGAADIGSTAASYRFAANGTGLTALPGSITPASNTHTGAVQFWAGLS